jgi:hypothetical protein
LVIEYIGNFRKLKGAFQIRLLSNVPNLASAFSIKRHFRAFNLVLKGKFGNTYNRDLIAVG